LHFTDDALVELAALAIKKGTGARALRSLLEKLMLDTMYDLPGTDHVAKVTVNAPVVRGEAAPLLQNREKQAAA